MKPSDPLRVLHVVHALGVGGGETWLMELLRLWSRTSAVNIDFLLTGGRRDLFDDQAQALGAILHYARYERWNLPRFARSFRQLLREGRYDAIHDHADYVSGWHFLLGAGALPPVRVAHVHNPWLHIDANYAVSTTRRLATVAGKRLVNRLATDVCGTSAEILRTYGFHPGQNEGPRVSVAHCGIDVGKFNAPRTADRASVLQEFGWGQDSSIVLFAGRLDRALTFDHPQNHKNSWFALNVIRAAARKDPTLRLIMAGAGDSRSELQAQVREWGFNGRISVAGVRHDIPRLMRAADVLLFPSRQEGLGMVAVEAQAAALPILASTAVPRECVIVPELYDSLALDESLEDWAEALLRRIRKPRPDLASCGQAVEASPFSIANSARALESVYRRNHS